MDYLLHLGIYFSIYVLVALSLNLAIGYAGMLTLAHAAYYAVGAYTYALLAQNHDWGFVPAALAAGLVAATLSLALSLPAWRLRGDFFVLVSLAVQALVFSGLQNWSDPSQPLGSWANLTNGTFGIVAIPNPRLFRYEVSGSVATALFAALVAVTCGLFIRRLTESPWGRLLLALSEDELATRGLGKNTRLLKVQVLAFSCGFVAVAGALYASYANYVDPSSASLDASILMFCMVMVGGPGNFRGPVIGAGILVVLPEALRWIQFSEAQAGQIRLLTYGLLLVLLVHYRPTGLAGNHRLS